MRNLLLFSCVFCMHSYSSAMKPMDAVDLSYKKDTIKRSDIFIMADGKADTIPPQNVKSISMSNRSDFSSDELRHYFFYVTDLKPHLNVLQIFLNGTKVDARVIMQMTYVMDILRPTVMSLSCLTSSVKHLDLSLSDVDDYALAPIGRWRNLETLKLRATKVVSLNTEIKKIASLKYIDLQQTAVNVSAVANIPPSVSMMILRGCLSFKAEEFAFLTTFEALDYVDISETYFSDPRLLPPNIKEIMCQTTKGDPITAYYFPLTIMAINGIKLPSSAKYLGQRLEQIEASLKVKGV